MKKLILYTILILISLTPLNVLAWEYPNNDSGYPYRDSTRDIVDNWNTFTRNCTSYAVWKIRQSLTNFTNNPTGPNGQTRTMGNALNWDDAASAIGYTVSSTPSIGNPVNWDAFTGGAYSAGHVAWVERINNNNTVFISEWNWNDADGNYNERDGITGGYYLYIASSNIIIQNVTVQSGQTYNSSVSNNGTITVLPETTFQTGSIVNLSIN